jgi:hypothetical protein
MSLSGDMEEQTKLYNWLRDEYTELFKQQGMIRAQEKEKPSSNARVLAANKEFAVQYQKRYAVYQNKLAQYHQCQQTILQTTAKGQAMQMAKQGQAPQGGATSQTQSLAQRAQASSSSSGQAQIKTHTSTTSVAQSHPKSQAHQPTTNGYIATVKQAASSSVVKCNTSEIVKRAAPAPKKDENEAAFEHFNKGENGAGQRTVSKIPVTDLAKVKVSTEVVTLGKYTACYEDIRGQLLKRCMEMGVANRKGMSIWHAYWDGFRNFLLYRIGKAEFDELIVRELKFPRDMLSLHNHLVSALMVNIRSGATAVENVALLPYLCTNSEIQEYSEGTEKNSGSKVYTDHTEEDNYEDITSNIFSPIANSACMSSSHSGAETVPFSEETKEGHQEFRESTSVNIARLVDSIHGKVLETRAPSKLALMSASPDSKNAKKRKLDVAVANSSSSGSAVAGNATPTKEPDGAVVGADRGEQSHSNGDASKESSRCNTSVSAAANKPNKSRAAAPVLEKEASIELRRYGKPRRDSLSLLDSGRSSAGGRESKESSNTTKKSPKNEKPQVATEGRRSSRLSGVGETSDVVPPRGKSRRLSGAP